MKSRTDYIPRQCVAQVRRQVANYKRFEALSAEWVALGIERSRLQIKQTRIGSAEGVGVSETAPELLEVYA